MTDQQDKGKTGEKLAVDYLQAQGYQILDTNYHARQGEIDIIAEEKGILVFVEVKYYQEKSLRSLYEAVDRDKQQKIIKTAERYLFREKIENKYTRFDVVLIEFSNTDQVNKIDLIRDAFRA